MQMIASSARDQPTATRNITQTAHQGKTLEVRKLKINTKEGDFTKKKQPLTLAASIASATATDTSRRVSGYKSS